MLRLGGVCLAVWRERIDRPVVRLAGMEDGTVQTSMHSEERSNESCFVKLPERSGEVQWMVEV